jgi:hypothetical protein
VAEAGRYGKDRQALGAISLNRLLVFVEEFGRKDDVENLRLRIFDLLIHSERMQFASRPTIKLANR